jgi:hypothetical protein
MQLQFMRPGRLVIGLAVLLPLTAAWAPRGTTVTFAVEEGTSLTKTYTQTLIAELTEASIIFNDEEQEIEEMPEFSIESTETIVFTDTYDSVEDGRATTLTRTFDELARSRVSSAGGEEVESEETSELEQTTIIFKWDEDEEEYIARFSEDDEDGDEDLLEGLYGDADLLGFLPEGEVEVDDTWEVELKDYRRLFSPSGELIFLDEDGETSVDELDEQLDENREGEIECTFMGVEEVDDVRMAVIDFTIELESEAEVSEELPTEDPEMGPVMTTQRISTSAEYEGTIYFDLAAGHVASVTIVGESEITLQDNAEFELPNGMSIAQERARVFEAEVEGEVTFE